MIIDISNEIITILDAELVGLATISSPNQDEVVEFPHVTFSEEENIANELTFDTSGEQHNDMSFEIEIYTTGDTKMTDAKVIRNKIDTVLNGLGLRRNFSQSIPNFLDKHVYRYVLRYACTVDETKTIYRR